MFLPLLAAALAAPASPAPALARFGGLALDPQAKRIATIDAKHQATKPVPDHGIVVIRDTGGKVLMRYDPCEVCRYEGLAWSPDGARLAFVGSAGGNATLYVVEQDKVRTVTSVKGLAAGARWSPTGDRLAMLVTQDATKETGATQPGVRQVGVIGAHEDSRRIGIVPATGGAYRLVSPEGTFVYEYAWTPDGQGFVGTAAEGNGDNQWWVATLRAFPIDGAMRTIASPSMQMDYPRVSPDGRTVAFIGGLMSDFGSVGGDIYTVPLAGGEPRNVTPDYRGTFTSLAWTGPKLLAGVLVGGSTGTAIVDPARGAVEPAILDAASMEAGDGRVAIDRSGTLAATVGEGFATPPRILFGPLGRMRPITHDNDALAPITVARDLRWRNDGRDLQGWLLAPTATPTGSAKQPMITAVHGGPAAAATPRFPWVGATVALLKHGYWLFLPNPRGSYGQGAAFVRANVKDFGGGDLSDILAGIDAAERVAPIDDARLGIYGHSYGGFMTMWTVTHSQRFHAAIAGAGIANWISYYGQNGIDQWMIPYFGASAYDDPRVYDRLSPIRSIRDAKTPTLMYVGERDVETPAAQSLEFWHGLRAMNVPTELVIYQDEGHGIRQPEHIADQETRMLGWFDRWLGR